MEHKEAQAQLAQIHKASGTLLHQMETKRLMLKKEVEGDFKEEYSDEELDRLQALEIQKRMQGWRVQEVMDALVVVGAIDQHEAIAAISRARKDMDTPAGG